MTHWYDDPQWDRDFKRQDDDYLEDNTTRPLVPFKYYDDYNLNTFRNAWTEWDIPIDIQDEWDAMIQKAFHAPLEPREEPQP